MEFQLDDGRQTSVALPEIRVAACQIHRSISRKIKHSSLMPGAGLLSVWPDSLQQLQPGYFPGGRLSQAGSRYLLSSNETPVPKEVLQTQDQYRFLTQWLLTGISAASNSV